MEGEAPTTAWQAGELHALADLLADLTPAALTVDHLDQLEALERIKAAKAAVAHAEVGRDDGVRRCCGRRGRPGDWAADAAEGDVDRRRGRAGHVGQSARGRAAGAALASPARRPPLTLAALGRGELTEDRAFAVAREVAHLTPEQRTRVDEDLADRLVGLGDVRLRESVRRSCLSHASEAETRRYTRARADRRVTTRRLDDGTGQVTATLPLEVMAAVRAALDEAAATARTAGDVRTGGQVRADTLAARITGHDPASAPTPVRVNLVIGIESLLGEGTEPGLIPGAGFLPAALCTRLVARASAAAKATLRRLFVTPTDRALVAMESTSRRFDGLLAEFLDLRDGGLCRTTGCNAPIRHHDHITPAADRGPTVAANGQGLCERCNYLKESPGWTSWIAHDPSDGHRHEVRGATEHLRLHHSTAPPMPGGPGDTIAYSPVELQLASAYTLVS